jgi:hypothetical protein
MRAHIEILMRELNVNSRLVQTPTDYELIRIIEDRVAKAVDGRPLKTCVPDS